MLLQDIQEPNKRESAKFPLHMFLIIDITKSNDKTGRRRGLGLSFFTCQGVFLSIEFLRQIPFSYASISSALRFWMALPPLLSSLQVALWVPVTDQLRPHNTGDNVLGHRFRRHRRDRILPHRRLGDFTDSNGEWRLTLAGSYLPYVVALSLIGIIAFQMDGVYIGSTWSREMRNLMAISLLLYFAAWSVLQPLYGNDGLWLALLLFQGARSIAFRFMLPKLADRTFAWSQRLKPTYGVIGEAD